MQRTALSKAARVVAFSLLIAVGALVCAPATLLADSPLYFTDKMVGTLVLAAAQTPNAWYVDRYAPASFESTTFDGQPRLHIAISTSDSAANRPLGFDSTFYNTQGRKIDINTPVNSYIAGDLYIGADWETHNRRSDLWATTFDAVATTTPSGYPIFGFVHNNSYAPSQNGFRVFDQTSGWTMVPLPVGFTYGSWHNLRIEMYSDSFKYYLDGTLVYIDTVTNNSATFGNMMVQAYNFGDENYDAYWDNVASRPIGYVEPVDPPETTTSPVPPSGRVSGGDDFSLSVAASLAGFSAADTVVLSTNRTFADAMSASGLAGCYHAPILLTAKAAVPAVVMAEIKRLGAKKVIVTGSTASVSDAVRSALVAEGLGVQRIGGKTRYDTAVLLAQEIAKVRGMAPTMTVVARGDTFPDALSVSPVAYASKAAVVLTTPKKLPRSPANYLKTARARTTVIAGGTSAVSSAVAKSIRSRVKGALVRLSGRDRYATSVAVSKWAVARRIASPVYTGVASGTRFAAALVAGPPAGERGGVVLILPRNSIPSATASFVKSHKGAIKTLDVFGDSGSVSDASLAELLSDAGL
jgi:putative cell wall-binding protein